MKRIAASLFFVGVLIACNKDKFQTKPTLEILSVSTDVVPVNGDLRVLLEYTDKEGDLQGSNSIIMYKQRLNRRPVQSTLFDSIQFSLPEFPQSDLAQIQLDMRYQGGLISASPPLTQNGAPNNKEPDTLRLKFIARDKAGNESDTTSTVVVIIRN